MIHEMQFSILQALSIYASFVWEERFILQMSILL